MLRVIYELQPVWIVGENVPGITKIALDDILDSIEAEGYSERTYSYPASIIGACHKRERIFIVAHSDNPAPSRQRKNSRDVYQITESEGSNLCNCYDSNPNGKYGQEYQPGDKLRHAGKEMPVGRGIYESGWEENWIAVATRLCRMDYGVSNRLHRLIALGNAVVPQQVYPILKAIADIERGR